MKSFTCPVSELHRLAFAALLLAALPLLACNNSDSIGKLGAGGSAGLGGNQGGTGGAGAGGAQSGVGGSGAGGSKTGQGGGSGGTQTGAGGAGGSGADGGRDAASDTVQCLLTNVYCAYGYTTDANGCQVCAPATGGAGGNGGTGGAGGSDAAGTPDAQVSVDAQALAALCTSSGGSISTGLCCNSSGDFPDSCLIGACGCAPTSSHTVATCACPAGTCFSTSTGCGPSGGGTGGSGGGTGGSGGGSGTLDAAQDSAVVCGSATCGAGEYCCNAESSLCAPIGYGCIQGSDGDAAQDVDSNGCTALPASDSTMCVGSYPPHFYRCILTMLSSPCVTLTIGDVTNTFCCP